MISSCSSASAPRSFRSLPCCHPLYHTLHSHPTYPCRCRAFQRSSPRQRLQRWLCQTRWHCRSCQRLRCHRKQPRLTRWRPLTAHVFASQTRRWPWAPWNSGECRTSATSRSLQVQHLLNSVSHISQFHGKLGYNYPFFTSNKTHCCISCHVSDILKEF